MPLLLSELDVRHLIDLDALIDAMAPALAEFSTRKAVQPLRTVLRVPGEAGLMAVMPAFLSGPPALGSKLVTVFHGNADAGLPTHLATIVLLDPSTGELLAILDGRYITETRTAAVSALSARYLARRDAATLGIVGSGVQAGGHLDALRRVRTLRDVRVWSPNAGRCRAFAERHATTVDCPVRAVASADDAVADADLVVLATSSAAPVIRGTSIRDGAHVMAVGTFRPDWREMDTALVTRSRVFVDSREAALTEAGDIVIPIAEGHFEAKSLAGELGELVAGLVPGRQSERDVTIFKSVGMAVEDVAAAAMVYRRAVETGTGRVVEV